jgi:hypothetical protein
MTLTTHGGDVMRSILILLSLSFSFSAQANTEPSYCSISAFKNHEVSYSASGLKRLHVYELGKVHLAGLGVGTSSYKAIEKMVQSYSNNNKDQKYCTFYFNQGNIFAAHAFSHHPVPNPGNQSVEKTQKIYGDEFAEVMSEPNNFLSCARSGAIALGCNSQKHRGPTVFGMLLAFSGCEPQHAADIVNDVWGLNGVPAENRLGAIAQAAELASINPEESAELRALFEEK